MRGSATQEALYICSDVKKAKGGRVARSRSTHPRQQNEIPPADNTVHPDQIQHLRTHSHSSSQDGRLCKSAVDTAEIEETLPAQRA